jgi:hypothetical protein
VPGAEAWDLVATEAAAGFRVMWGQGFGVEGGGAAGEAREGGVRQCGGKH